MKRLSWPLGILISIVVFTLGYLHPWRTDRLVLDQQSSESASTMSSQARFSADPPPEQKPLAVEEQMSVAASHEAALDAAELAARAAGETTSPSP